MLRPEERRLAFFAVCVRLVVLLLTTALDVALPDYDTSKFITPETAKHVSLSPTGGLGTALRHPTAPFQGWLVWDSVFFADIRARGYIYEQYFAFFPLLPGEYFMQTYGTTTTVLPSSTKSTTTKVMTCHYPIHDD